MTFSKAPEYAKKGFHVFPVREGGKEPITEHGLKDATINPLLIEGWLKKYPNANVAINCGASDIVCLDIDDAETFKELISRCPEILETAVQATPRLGRHIFFRDGSLKISSKNGQIKDYPRLDIKGQGGYAIVEGHTDKGVYIWEQGHSLLEIEPKPLPSFLEALLRKNGFIVADSIQSMPNNKTAITAFVDQTSLSFLLEHYINVSRVGNRNDNGFKLACQLRDRGLNKDMAITLMLAYQKAVDDTNEPYTMREALASLEQAYSKQPRDKQYHLTDMGNAERFVSMHGHNLLYCHTWKKWLVWDGARWRPDSIAEAKRLAKDIVISMYIEAAGKNDDRERSALVGHAKNSESDYKIKATLSLAESDAMVTIEPSKFDMDAFLLNVLNGIIDLRTGQILPHSREDYITKLAHVVYDKNASCPLWLAFLDRIFGGNQSMITFVQVAAGYSLTGDTREQCLFILYGTGANGKSTFLNVIKAIMGDYALQVRPETLMAMDNIGVRNDIARLAGGRLVTSTEAEEGKRLAESQLKQMTGCDTMTARFLYSEDFEFVPQFKLWLATNHKPPIKDTDNAIWRRIRLIPFNVTIPENEMDRELPSKLLKEAPGILNWLIEGCLLWQKEGLITPDIVKSATDSYRSEMDVLRDFLDEKCIIDPYSKIPKKVLYEAYVSYCTDNGDEPVSKNAFARRLKEKGITEVRTGSQRLWKGIDLKRKNEIIGIA